MANQPESIGRSSVLLFDGECGLCHRIVRLLLRLDRSERIRFAPLQGPAGQAYLKQHGLPTREFDSLVWIPDWDDRQNRHFLLRTDGVIAALRACGGAAAAAGSLLNVIPRRLRDGLYRLIGRTRYLLFGAWKDRPLRNPKWTARFLA